MTDVVHPPPDRNREAPGQSRPSRGGGPDRFRDGAATVAAAAALHVAALILLLHSAGRRLPPPSTTATLTLVLTAPPAAASPSSPAQEPSSEPMVPDLEIGPPAMAPAAWLPPSPVVMPPPPPAKPPRIRPKPRPRPLRARSSPPLPSRPAAPDASPSQSPPELSRIAGTAVAQGGGTEAATRRASTTVPAGPDPSWQARLAAWIVAHKRYPEASRERGRQGTVTIRFTVARDGRVLDVTLVHGSGTADLDEAATELLRGADVPPFPPDMKQLSVSVAADLEYTLQ